MILFVPGRGEKNEFDAFLCDTFCSQRRLLPDTEKKIGALFFIQTHREKLLLLLRVILLVPRRGEKIDALVCDPFCSRTRRENPV